MGEHYRIVLAALAGVLIGSGVATALAQSQAFDPPRVAPHIFEVALENERVRVLRVTERHGETQPLHRLRDRVEVYLSNCAWMVEEEDGSARMEGYRVGDVVWRAGVARGGRTSNVIDACVSLAIELKD